MSKSNKTIIDYIPPFLDYCKKEKGLSPNSIIDYSKYLNQFILWIKKYNLFDLTPEKLSLKHIEKYKECLSACSPPKSTITQNTYLIALRSLLSYFIEKNISSLLPHNIKLIKEENLKNSTSKILTSKQIKKILKAPNILTKIGLRDRVILEILFSTGLKVSQLVALNRNQIEIDPNSKNIAIRILGRKNSYFVYLPKRVVYWLKKYLKTREDKSKALLINYRSKSPLKRRLSTRAVENIIKNYVTRTGLSSSFTPETLRNAYTSILLNEKFNIKIDQPSSHKISLIEKYKLSSCPVKSTIYRKIQKSQNSLPWYIIENFINEEILWLKNNISTSPYESDNQLIITCKNCLLRKIAILIISGKIEAVQFKAKGVNLWSKLTNKTAIQALSRHGQEWHRKMMDIVSEYFKLKKFRLVLEPILHYGRADLGVYPNSSLKESLYVEIGTVSLYKLWYNLSTMKNTTFLIVPSEKYVIKFKVL